MSHPRPPTPTPLAPPARQALLLLGSLLVASALLGCGEPLRQRKNVKDLSPEERQDFVNAVLRLKATPSPYDSKLSWYDQFVYFHKQVYYYKLVDRQGNPYETGHKSPTFLPWHRKLLLMYEQALSEVSGKDIPLPYWDWTDPGSVSVVFSEQFMGGGGEQATGFAVLSGSFKKDDWEVKVFPLDESGQEDTTPHLTRTLGKSLDPKTGALVDTELPVHEDMKKCLELGTYDAHPWNEYSSTEVSFRSCLEGWGHGKGENHLHNSAHIWVGGSFVDPTSGKTLKGSMAALDTAPNDPAFFLHHANVDRIWALWERRHGASYMPEAYAKPGWSKADALFPFSRYKEDPRVRLHGNTVGDMLDISRQDYEYR